MRIIVMFDLPTLTTSDRKQYSQFKKNLASHGYYMLQFSIYVRICKNNKDAQRKVKLLKKFIPPQGQVRGLVITDKQYQKMLILLGEQNIWEDAFSENNKTIII